MAHTIVKALYISIDELMEFAKCKNIKIKSAQHILSVDEANILVDYIHGQKQKLHFSPEDWQSLSNIDDYQNLIEFIDITLKTIDSQISQNSDILKNSNNSYRALQKLDMNNSELIEIKTYLLSKFDFSLENLKDKLIFMKSEALEFLDEIDNSNSIWSDKQYSKTEINFHFTATKIVRLYEEQIKKVENFSKVDKFFSTLLKEVKKLQNLDEKFTTTDKNKLETVLKDGYLEEHNQKIYEEWSQEVAKINKLYIKFIKAYFTDKISQHLVLEFFKIFASIREDLQNFYLDIRSGLLTKYKDNPKSDLLQEVASKDRVLKIYQNSQAKFIVLLQKESSQVAYRFLNNILSELLDFKIEQKSEGYEDIYKQMAQLHSTNLEIYLNDIVVYGKELEKRDMEISKLMFKMRTDLEKKGE